MTSDGLEPETGTNPGDGADGADDQGGGEAMTLDKVAELMSEHGVDIRGAIEADRQRIAGETAVTVGKKAQATYDPKITALEKALQDLQGERDKLWEDGRKAELAKLPPEQRASAEKLFEGEKTVKYLKSQAEQLGMAAKVIEAEKTALALQKQGIEAKPEDFMEFATPEAMHTKAAELRADEAERKLRERDEGKPPAGKLAPGQSAAPASASSGKPAARPATVGSAPHGSGPKVYEDLKGKGLSTANLAEALRRMREAG